MIRFLREYLKLMIPLLIAMGLYRVFAVPWLEPRAKVTAKAPWTQTARAKETHWWSQCFLPGAWQNDNPTVVKTVDGVSLLFKEWEAITPDRWRVYPLTIIVPRGERSTNKQATPDEVLFIENPEGAEIQFQDAFDLAGPPPPVVGGHLSGPVRIVGPSTQAGQDDIWIETRDIHIDRKQLWTSHEVNLKLGNSHITGRDLSILLDQDLLSSVDAPLAEESPFQGLDQLKLMYVDRVEFDLPKGGLWSPPDPGKKKLPAKANLTCQGSFHFDFHSAWAELSNGVQVVHQVQGQVEDHFTADNLRLQFLTRKRQQAPGDSAWTIQRMEAKGILHGESDRPGWLVQMDAPGMKTKAIGRRLVIDLNLGRIELANQIHSQQHESSRVFFEREGLRVWSPNLQFETPDLAIHGVPRAEDDTHIGALYAAGPGTAQLQTQDGDQWKLSWATLLSLQPDQNEDVLTIDGSANASSQKHGRFAAEHMYVWMLRMTDAMKQKYRQRYGDEKPNEILADRLYAKGQVLLDSPTLHAQVEDLKVWLVYPFLADGINSVPQVGQHGSSPIQLASHLPRAENSPGALYTAYRAPTQDPRRNSSPPTNPIYRAAPATPTAPKARLAQDPRPGNAAMPPTLAQPPSTPIHVTGPTLRSRVIIEPNRTEIDDLEIEGGVTLIRNEDRQRGTLPFTITGEQLKMNTSAEGLSDVQILGAPAEIKMGGGLLTGPEVRFNQRDQLVWMDHPGTLIVPPEVLMKPGIASPGNGIRWLKPPKIDWNGGMNFDGRTARLDGGVSIEADMMTGPETRWLVHGNSRSMEVQLTQPVSMGTPKNQDANLPPLGASELGQITLRQQVDIQGIQSDAAGNRISRERFWLPEEFTVHFPTKRFGGKGPGAVLSRRLSKENELLCINLVYSGGLTGNFENNDVEFQRDVEVLLGPIRTWEDSLNVETFTNLLRDQTLLTCDFLRAYSTANLSWNRQSGGNAAQAWELEARDNVNVESRSAKGDLTVRAPKMQYASPQEMLRIYGTPYQHGIINMPGAKPGDPPARFEFSYFEVFPKSMDKGAMNLISASTGEVTGFQATSSPRDRLNPNASNPNAPNPSRPTNNPNAFGDPRNLPSPRFNPRPNR